MIYSKLNEARREIRLLVIQPSLESDAITECSMTIYSLDEIPEYLALSYVWGNPSVTTEITVNSVSMAVTTNLAAALRQIRAHQSGEGKNAIKGLPVLIWIDAICINQQDIPERNFQVQLMRDIYRSAMKTLSWLGPEADNSTQAVGNLKMIAQEIAELPQEGDRFSWLQRYPSLLEDTPGHTPWKHFDLLWKRDYWTRIWVLQEIILAKEVLLLCGEATLLLEDILTVDKWVNAITRTDKCPSFISLKKWLDFASHSIFNPEPVQRSALLRTLWNSPAFSGAEVKPLSFRILGTCWGIQATDPRDFVYGLLGITVVNIVPDYSKSVQNVYIEAAIEHLKLYGLTLALNGARKNENKFNLPSWVPDWSNSRRRLVRRKYFSDSKGPNPDPTTFRIDLSKPGTLCVKGVRLCRVLELDLPLESEFPSNIKAPVSVRAWRLCQDIVKRYGNQLYPARIPPLQALLRLFVNDADKSSENDQLKIPSEMFFKLAFAFLGCMVRRPDSQILATNQFEDNLPKIGLVSGEGFAKAVSEKFLGPGFDLPPSTSVEQALSFEYNSFVAVLEGMAWVFKENQFFYTDDGYFGYGPLKIQPHDFVCAVKGCDFPVILRQGDMGLALVGTCIVQGLIDEGILKEAIDRAIYLEEFDLL